MLAKGGVDFDAHFLHFRFENIGGHGCAAAATRSAMGFVFNGGEGGSSVLHDLADIAGGDRFTGADDFVVIIFKDHIVVRAGFNEQRFRFVGKLHAFFTNGGEQPVFRGIAHEHGAEQFFTVQREHQFFIDAAIAVVDDHGFGLFFRQQGIAGAGYIHAH